MAKIAIDEALLVTQPRCNSSGYTWTLASRLGHMLHVAEELFGQRDCSYTILGIEFRKGNPQIWYPTYGEDKQNIVVQLCLTTATVVPANPKRVYHELAHETVHLLAPTGCKHATNLEEGVACFFADYYLEHHLKTPRCWPLNPRSYQDALDIVKPHLEMCSSGIRKPTHAAASIRKN